MAGGIIHQRSSIEQSMPERLLVRNIANAAIELGVDDAIAFVDVPPSGGNVGQLSFLVLDLSKSSSQMQHVASAEQTFDAGHAISPLGIDVALHDPLANRPRSIERVATAGHLHQKLSVEWTGVAMAAASSVASRRFNRCFTVLVLRKLLQAFA